MKTLKEFYQTYAVWLDSGAPDNKPFTRTSGLCHNLEVFSQDYESLLAEMQSEFKAKGLDKYYPFNIDEEHYVQSGMDGTQYTNYKRVEWVKEHSK